MSTVCKSPYSTHILKHLEWKQCSAMKRFTKERFLVLFEPYTHYIWFLTSSKAPRVALSGWWSRCAPSPSLWGWGPSLRDITTTKGCSSRTDLTYHYFKQSKIKCEHLSFHEERLQAPVWKKKQHWNAGKLSFFLIKPSKTTFKIKASKTVVFLHW